MDVYAVVDIECAEFRFEKLDAECTKRVMIVSLKVFLNGESTKLLLNKDGCVRCCRC